MGGQVGRIRREEEKGVMEKKGKGRRKRWKVCCDVFKELFNLNRSAFH